jgi:hypothetical protein
VLAARPVQAVHQDIPVYQVGRVLVVLVVLAEQVAQVVGQVNQEPLVFQVLVVQAAFQELQD